MIKPYFYDVEVLPNFFSITLVSINSYLETFKDCVDKDGNPIPLVEKYSVKEIKEKLKSIETYSFYISDKQSSKLLEMIAFLGNLKVEQRNIYSHLFGYNSFNYDKIIVAYLLMNFNNFATTKDLCYKIYEMSKHIISVQDDKTFYKDYAISICKQYNLPYTDIDIMKIFALNKTAPHFNKTTGKTEYYGKSLKQTSINIKWYEILEYSLPPISNLDYDYYQKDKSIYKGLPVEELNELINPFDRYIIDDWIPETIRYNTNDVFIGCEMIRLFQSEIKLRYSLSRSYNIDLLNSSRSKIADKLFSKYYCEYTNLKEKDWKGKKSERTVLSFKRVIFDKVKFKTKPMQDFLNNLYNIKIYHTDKESFSKEIKIGNLIYTMATGGIHSKDIPRELISTAKDISPLFTGNKIKSDEYFYMHFDIDSFYPTLMYKYHIAPEHLDKAIFCKLVEYFRNTRVKAKKTKGLIDGIPASDLAQALKIVINSIYGKFGSEDGELYDRLALLKVTINGQLFILMLCEELELNGIEVVSANTDGIVVKIYGDKYDKFNEITNNWLEYTQLSASSEYYKKYINRDINNYIIEEYNDNVSYKGALDPNRNLNDLTKGYDSPIIAKAIYNYFIKGIPIMETLYNSKDILDFCKTKNVTRRYHLLYNNKNVQRNTRYYVSNEGDELFKVDNSTGRKDSLCAKEKVIILNTLDDKNIAERNIKYKYYYEECYKIIDQIKLNISVSSKPNDNLGTKSGKVLVKKYAGCYKTLFDE